MKFCSSTPNRRDEDMDWCASKGGVGRANFRSVKETHFLISWSIQIDPPFC